MSSAGSDQTPIFGMLYIWQQNCKKIRKNIHQNDVFSLCVSDVVCTVKFEAGLVAFWRGQWYNSRVLYNSPVAQW